MASGRVFQSPFSNCCHAAWHWHSLRWDSKQLAVVLDGDDVWDTRCFIKAQRAVRPRHWAARFGYRISDLANTVVIQKLTNLSDFATEQGTHCHRFAMANLATA